MMAPWQSEAQTALEVPSHSLTVSFFAMRHEGARPTVRNLKDAAFGGPVHTWEPDDGPDADADNPNNPDDAEPDDVAQVDAGDSEWVDSPGGSLTVRNRVSLQIVIRLSGAMSVGPVPCVRKWIQNLWSIGVMTSRSGYKICGR